MRFPRGNNRNRPLKRMPLVDFESPQEVERLFRRFWREREVGRRVDEGGGAMRLGILLLGCLLAGCGGGSQPPADNQPDPVAQARAAGAVVDTVGLLDLAEADTLNGDQGLTIVETTISFPAAAAGGEVFAWEFNARELRPVKLLVMRFDQTKDNLELVGESELVVPRQQGPNRFSLREPIPIKPHDFYGIYQPEAGTIPFKKVLNWKTLITPKPLTRPWMKRDLFSMYGWRYALRVFWRKAPGSP